MFERPFYSAYHSYFQSGNRSLPAPCVSRVQRALPGQSPPGPSSRPRDGRAHREGDARVVGRPVGVVAPQPVGVDTRDCWGAGRHGPTGRGLVGRQGDVGEAPAVAGPRRPAAACRRRQRRRRAGAIEDVHLEVPEGARRAASARQTQCAGRAGAGAGMIARPTKWRVSRASPGVEHEAVEVAAAVAIRREDHASPVGRPRPGRCSFPGSLVAGAGRVRRRRPPTDRGRACPTRAPAPS